ncbi:MAG: hypothetical protein J6W62_06950 [Spirochaetia bacterium]|nr:hypothetical protein [Spirochaetia bacterium]
MKEEKVKEKKYPIFINNNPRGEDSFEGKSHEKIANCIVNQLKANENCNIIGIEGSWGSGKSNLVKLIKDKLKQKNGQKTNDFFIYTYDVWGYQNDYLKRSVLENLLTFLIKDEEGPRFSRDWNDSLKRLLSRKETIGSRIVKEINVFTKLSIIMTFAYIAFSFLKDLLFKKNYDTNHLLQLIISVGFFSIYILLLIYYWKKYKEKYGESEVSFFQWIFHSYYDFKNDAKSTGDSISTNTVYESEASTREFKDYIKSINEKLENNRLIIVFDNIDRLPIEKVKEVWAMINILFANDDTPNINVIVPFDRNHIISAFKEENIEINADNTGNTKPYDTKLVSYGDDFINKTFNVVFRVSLPTMSNWKAFFNDLWKYAFNEDVDYSVLQIYDLLTIDNQTPRKMIAFINEFVSIRKIFDKFEIPDKYIALFIFGKNKIQANPTKEILTPSFLGALNFKYEKDADLQKYLSALYYQLSPELALDLIYTDQIVKALDNKNSDLLQKIKALNNFYPILQNAITKITNIPNTVIVLNEILEDGPNMNLINTWDCVYDQINTSENMLQEYQEILISKITNKDKYLKRILDEFANSSNFKIEDYFLSLKRLLDLKIGLTIQDFFVKKEVVPADFITFVELAKEDYQQYSITCNFNELDKYLSKQSSDSLKVLNAFKYIKIDNENSFWGYKARIEAIIDSNPNDEKTVPAMYERLKELAFPVSHIIPDPAIVNLFAKLNPKEDFYYDLICMRISRLTSFQGGNSILVNQIMTKTETDFIRRIASKIHYYIDFDNLLHNISVMKGYPLYIELCKELITNNEYNQVAILHKLLCDYQIIKDITKLDSQYIISCYNWWDSYETITVENISEIPISYFVDAKKNPDELFEHCNKTANEYLLKKNKNDWMKSIEAESYDYKLICILALKNEYCYEAFQELMISKAKSENVKFNKNIAVELVTLALKNERNLRTLFNDIRDLFCNGKHEMTEELFDFFGEWLFMYSDITAKKEALRRILPIKIMEKPCVISVIISYSDIVIKMIKNSEDEGQDFKEKISTMVEYKSEDTRFIDFAKRLGIEYRNREIETTNE